MKTPLLPSEQLTYSTVRIECVDATGSAFTGTGFFFRLLEDGSRHVPVIVTNKHVVAGATAGRFVLTLKDEDGGPKVGHHRVIETDNFEQMWIPHPDPDVDLCVTPVSSLLHQAAEAGISFFFISLDKSLVPTPEDLGDLGALEDVVMIGYPNGIWDAVNNLPIIRRGVTATHPAIDYEGRGEFMIDAACFPGSSGSPVFLYNSGGWTKRGGGQVLGGFRLKLLGTLYAGPQHVATGEVKIVNVPTQQRAVAVSAIPQNLGLVIKARRLLEMDGALKAAFPQASL